jgi:cytochrome c peroxidase
LALAGFVRSLASWDSPFDRWQRCGDQSAISESARRGYALFRGRGGCAGCHDATGSSPTFTDDRYHSVGPGAVLGSDLSGLLRRLHAAGPSGSDLEAAPLGRFLVTGQPSDIAAFRTPSLRNVALTAPYLHDGRLTTLREVVDWEVDYRGRTPGEPLILTSGEREDLVAFMETLTSADLDGLARWTRRLAADGGAPALADRPGQRSLCTGLGAQSDR